MCQIQIFFPKNIYCLALVYELSLSHVVQEDTPMRRLISLMELTWNKFDGLASSRCFPKPFFLFFHIDETHKGSPDIVFLSWIVCVGKW